MSSKYDLRWRYGRKGDFFVSVGVLSADVAEVKALPGKSGFAFFIYIGNPRDGEWVHHPGRSLEDVKRLAEIEVCRCLDEILERRKAVG